MLDDITDPMDTSLRETRGNRTQGNGWTEKPGILQFRGHKVRHNLGTEQRQQQNLYQPISQFLKEKIPIVPHIPIHEMHGTKHFKELLYKVLANIKKGRRKINEDEEIIW